MDWMMARSWRQMRDQGKVDDIAQDDREQSLQKIEEHR